MSGIQTDAQRNDQFLNRLVIRPGKKKEDMPVVCILRWVISQTAKNFETTSEWLTVDDLACEYVESGLGKASGDGRRQAARRSGVSETVDIDPLFMALLRMPPALGFISDEHVRLTALGLLLAPATTAPIKSRLLTDLAKMCYELFLIKEKRVIDREEFKSEYCTRYCEDLQESGQECADERALEALDLVLMLPVVSLYEDPGGNWSLTIYRTALEYKIVAGKDEESDMIAFLEVLIRQTENRLGLQGKEEWKKLLDRLRRWTRLLESIILLRTWQGEEAIDSGPPWMPGNDLTEVQPDLTRQSRIIAQPDRATESDDDRSVLTSLLGVYATQYGSYTTLLWQVPALSLTAQAFLMTIALSDDTNMARLIASVLSIMIAGTSISLMHNQRGHAINHGVLALRVSRKLGLARELGKLAIDDAKPEFADAETVWVGWDRHIYHVWKICLGLFIAADVAVIILTIIAIFTGSNSWWF